MFIQVLQGRCSRPDELRSFSEGWKTDLGPGAAGFLGGTFGVTQDGQFIGVVRFASAADAAASSARPEQDAWAQEFAGYLDGPPSFTDYEDVSEFLDGGSDAAGFVQVIRGTTPDVAAFKALLADPGQLKEMRPEIIGGTFAVDAEGGYTETVYFTDEAAARGGEQQEPPAEVRETLEKVLAGASFFDLHDPWFESEG
ncbi:MAG: hypothetical protein ACJ72E_13530 [Marmoricola sp.]